jgi:hypothetical protein
MYSLLKDGSKNKNKIIANALSSLKIFFTKKLIPKPKNINYKDKIRGYLIY